jgi:hypothetical protein
MEIKQSRLDSNRITSNPSKKYRRDISDAIFHQSIDTILQLLKTFKPYSSGIEFTVLIGLFIKDFQ